MKVGINNMMKSIDFINELKHVASLPTVYYSVAGGDWAKWNGKTWNFDCVILVKAILWGWNEDKCAPHGGAVYGSNGVYDDSADTIINRCKDVSINFKSITPGELLWMNGHVGIYIGNGQVIECTAAWEGKVLYSTIDSNGNRSRNGVACGRWLKHGKLPYLTYDVASSANTNTTTTSSKKSNEEIAKEVIAGDWGNGDSRKQELTKAGYDYDAIQAIVNKRYGVSTSTLIKVGDKVRVLNAVQYSGQTFNKYYDSYDVIEVSGDRVVIGIGKTVTCAINVKDVQKI